MAGPEAANNAGAQASFIPMLALGIPPNAVMALMIAAMTIHGITPGPKFLTEKPTLFWAMVASMWIGNLMLVILNLPLVGLWVRLLRIPYAYLFPIILVFCCIGVYSLNYRLFDVVMMAVFGLAGYRSASGLAANPRLLCSDLSSAPCSKSSSAGPCCWRTEISRSSSSVRWPRHFSPPQSS